MHRRASRLHPALCRKPVSLALTLALGCVVSAHAADGLTNMGAPAALDGATNLAVVPTDVSDDGMTVVGQGFGRLGGVFTDATYRWSPGGGFEDLAQGDGLKVSRKKSGVVVWHMSMQELVEQATAERSRSPRGLVVGYGAEESVGWEQQWRAQLCASAAVSFVWRSSGCEVELPDPGP